MNVIHFVIKRAPCEPAFSPNAPCEPISAAALIAAAAISATASTASNMMNNASANSINLSNKEMAREQMRWQSGENFEAYRRQLDLQNQQNQFNLDMWNQANVYNEKYNDPSAVVDRLKRAGLNPQAYFGSPATSDVSGISASQASVPSGVSPVMPQSVFSPTDLSGIGNAANAFFQNQLLNKQADSMDVDTQIKKVELYFKSQKEVASLQETLASIQEKLGNVKKGSAEYDKLISEKDEIDWRLKLFKDTFEDMKERSKKENKLLDAQESNLISDTALKRIQGQLQSMNMQWFPKMQQAQLDVLRAQQTEIINSAALLVQQGKLVDKQACEQFIKNRMLNLEFNDQKIKHAIKNGENKATKTLYYFADYCSSLLFGNLKLFGK